MNKNKILAEIQAGLQALEEGEYDQSDFINFIRELLKENGWEI